MMWGHFLPLIAGITFIGSLGYIYLSPQAHNLTKINHKLRRKNIPDREIVCGNNLKKILIAINFNWPHYPSLQILKEFYEDVFGKVVFCGNIEYPGVIVIDENGGRQGYECIATAIRIFPNFTGYIHSNDDVLLNWWNLMKLDVSKIWLGTNFEAFGFRPFGKTSMTNWWRYTDPARKCEVAFDQVVMLSLTSSGRKLDFPKYLNRFFTNTNKKQVCVNGRADFFYIPREFAAAYAKLSQIYKDEKVHLEILVPTALTFFWNKTNHINVNGIYLPDVYPKSKYEIGTDFSEIYSFYTSFYHPIKLEKQKNADIFLEIITGYGDITKRYCALKLK